jgi:hypothetical protein
LANFNTHKEQKSNISEYLIVKDISGRSHGDTLSMVTRVARLDVCRHIMIAGIAVNKLNDPVSNLLELFEQASGKLSMSSIIQSIPELLKLEIEKLCTELVNNNIKAFSLIF